MQLMKNETKNAEFIPTRFSEENRGGFRILAKPFINLCQTIIKIVLNDANKILNVAGKPNLQKLVDQILNNKQFLQQFIHIFEQLKVDVKEFELYIKNIWKIFINSLCNKAIWAIIKQKELNKPDMPLRSKLKAYNMAKKRNNFY